MPFEKMEPKTEDRIYQLRLWPHSSLPRLGFAAFVLTTFTLTLIPLFALLGTSLLWGLLPFILLAVGGIYWALQRSYQDRNMEELLTISSEETRVLRRNARGRSAQEWAANTYWTKLSLYETGGPVPSYVTLSGNGREIELGAFLSEEERKELYAMLLEQFALYRPGNV